MPITQKDIAQRLNLSRSMVGLVLSNHPSARVAAETRREILRTASELGYSPNAAAKSLRDGRTNVATVAVVTSKHESVGISHLALASRVVLYLANSGMRPSLCPLPTVDAMLSVLRDIARSKSSDGVVLTGDEDDVEQMGMLLEKEKMPFVVKGHHEERHPDWVQVDYDHRQMMELAVEELWIRGHRRIGFVTYDDSATYAHELERGFREAMARRLGGPIAPRLVRRYCYGDYDVDHIFESWLAMNSSEAPTAAVIAGGTSAWWAAELALAKCGREIGYGPNDFAITGLSTERELIYQGEALGFCTSVFEHIPAHLSRLIQERIANGKCEQIVTRIVPPLAQVGKDSRAIYYDKLFKARTMGALEGKLL